MADTFFRGLEFVRQKLESVRHFEITIITFFLSNQKVWNFVDKCIDIISSLTTNFKVLAPKLTLFLFKTAGGFELWSFEHQILVQIRVFLF